MRISRFDWDGSDPRGLATEIRSLQPSLGEVSEAVAAIVDAVATGGDAAVLRFEDRLGGVAPQTLRVPDPDLEAAPNAIPEDLAHAIRLAIHNVRRTTEMEARVGGAGSVGTTGASITFRDVPVSSAGLYVPGGAGAYPSTAVMCCVPARAAGVRRAAVASPPGPDGKVNPAVLAACALAGGTEVYAMGGAQAIAALVLGTESVAPVDVLVGPGNRYVQEAKRQLAGRVGIDGIAGPSELMILADGESDLRVLALDLCAQAEHGDDGLLVACAADDAILDELRELVETLAPARRTVGDAPLALVSVPSTRDAIDLADAVAPEHLELVCQGARDLAKRVQSAGCVFVGPYAGTAFGDYAVGSNHVLPTGGTGRFTGPLGPQTFRRRIATVEMTREGAQELAPTVATLARAEGFPVHGESAIERVAPRSDEERR